MRLKSIKEGFDMTTIIIVFVALVLMVVGVLVKRKFSRPRRGWMLGG